MTETRFPTTPAKVFVPILTLVLFAAMLLLQTPQIVAFLCFSSLITAMLHFNVFESTTDANPLNRIDLTLQVVFLIVSIGRAFILGSGHN
ncbi:hypothetical protein [Levilactobacillus tujiorum]|uniref:Uncharacterized protein n=1 Tax=Levilactobacillus tujiorum TaxID=2912243 RepID=A0ABX1L316_9LACO|nr:hypothetical protein [Levilactobacillus tujiorum]MCH5464184.1 hypothetical protein [Levilactobacillus tujiorum]NLR11630.1 hypothetical protein [Lactobacillus sp. HBUAS51387]NLR29088.1 hypothetical protein [Levilactobacillus tujiorum]NLR30882.1 hypothetical protein [Levilactobacillus tujiorum]